LFPVNQQLLIKQAVEKFRVLFYKTPVSSDGINRGLRTAIFVKRLPGFFIPRFSISGKKENYGYSPKTTFINKPDVDNIFSRPFCFDVKKS
jgi:hypothetical protein